MRRLQGASYWILCALSQGEAHGYLIAQRVEQLALGEVGVGPGTLYAALERLVDAGAIELAGEEAVDGRNRRTYRITGTGRDAVSAETTRRASAVRRARLAIGTA